MDAVLLPGRIVFLSLLFMEVIILLFRYAGCRDKREFLLFLLMIIFLSCKTLFSHLYFLNIGSSMILVYVTGNFIYTISPHKLNSLWTLCVALFSIIFIILMISGFTYTIYFTFFYFYVTTLLLLYPLRQLWRLYKIKGSKIFLLLLILSVLFIIAKSYDLASVYMGWLYVDLSLWVSICFIVGLGYLVFQKGYLFGQGMVGYNSMQSSGNDILHTVFSRIVQTEDTLLLQDRLITSGLLSAGTSHEFKNILSRIKMLSQFGLNQQNQKKKDEVIRGILENTEHGITVISEFFNILALKVEEKPFVINVKKVVANLIKLVRINYRNLGITFHAHIDHDILVFIGRGELEQIVLNLIRNGVESIAQKNPGEKKVVIRGFVEDKHVIIEVLDNGNGIPPEHVSQIFEPHFSGKQSSGLGLYLVKMLVHKNKGDIEYIHQPDGACFRLVFPLYEQGDIMIKK